VKKRPFRIGEEIASSKAALRVAALATAQSCDDLNRIALVFPDDPMAESLASRASKALEALHEIERDCGRFVRQIRAQDDIREDAP
jgi:hypothetical protein